MTFTAPAHILVVDDDPGIRSVLRRGLEAEGFVVSEAATRAQVLHAVQKHTVDLITLDLDLGTLDGLDLAQEIRSQRNVPIIMVTGRDAPADSLCGLEHGADDYVGKPFKIREVVLRIRNILRRYELESLVKEIQPTHDDGTLRYRFETGILDASRRELKSNHDDLIDLTNSEFDLLTIFLRHPARVLSRDEIMEMLKGQSWNPLDRTIDGHVARLRNKIEPIPEHPRLIKSVRGVGYVFTGEVVRKGAE